MFVYLEPADGIILAAENQHIGTISIEVKLAFKALDYNPADEADSYEDELAAKAEEKSKQSKKLKPNELRP